MRRVTLVTGGSETILVVEDEEPVRAWLARAMESLGYHVLQAGDGKEALDLTQIPGTRVAAVVSDVVIAGMSGAELHARLAESRPDLPVILMSAYGADELYARCIVPSGMPILMKPFELAELAVLVRRILDAPSRRPQVVDVRCHGG